MVIDNSCSSTAVNGLAASQGSSINRAHPLVGGSQVPGRLHWIAVCGVVVVGSQMVSNPRSVTVNGQGASVHTKMCPPIFDKPINIEHRKIRQFICM